MKSFLGLVVMFALVFAGCGGKELDGSTGSGAPESGSPDGDDGSGGNDGSGFDSPAVEDFIGDEVAGDTGSGEDSPTNDAAPDANSSCMETSSSGSAGPGGQCSTSVAEKCADGFSYQAQCSCAGGATVGTCTCTQMSSTLTGVSKGSYDGCAAGCSEDQNAFTSCGFPVPPP